MSLQSSLSLVNSTVRIPQLGFGVYRSSKQTCKASCLAALEAGYRHIDTAQLYKNEAQVGEAIRASGISRGEIFVTTKIFAAGGSPENTYTKCLNSVKEIDGEDGYVDLFLIHRPNGTATDKEIWQALERLLGAGKVKSIGVSNFAQRHIEAMQSYASVWPPPINQIEVRPTLSSQLLRSAFSLQLCALCLLCISSIRGVSRTR